MNDYIFHSHVPLSQVQSYWIALVGVVVRKELVTCVIVFFREAFMSLSMNPGLMQVSARTQILMCFRVTSMYWSIFEKFIMDIVFLCFTNENNKIHTLPCCFQNFNMVVG